MKYLYILCCLLFSTTAALALPPPPPGPAPEIGGGMIGMLAVGGYVYLVSRKRRR